DVCSSDLTERCVRLLFQDVCQVKTHLAYCFLAGVVNPQIPQVVRKEAAEQKLHGKIVEPFGAMPLIPILSCEGGLTEFFAHAQGHRLEHVEGGSVPHPFTQRVVQVISDAVDLTSDLVLSL